MTIGEFGRKGYPKIVISRKSGLIQVITLNYTVNFRKTHRILSMLQWAVLDGFDFRRLYRFGG